MAELRTCSVDFSAPPVTGSFQTALTDDELTTERMGCAHTAPEERILHRVNSGKDWRKKEHGRFFNVKIHNHHHNDLNFRFCGTCGWFSIVSEIIPPIARDIASLEAELERLKEVRTMQDALKKMQRDEIGE